MRDVAAIIVAFCLGWLIGRAHTLWDLNRKARIILDALNKEGY